MLNRVFADTLFVVALVNRRDQYHDMAVELADQFENFPLLITDAVLIEIASALARKYKIDAIKVIEHALASEEVRVVRLTPQLFDRAFEEYKKFRDKEWSLVDCISFIVMRDEGVDRALTFDKHFEQAGFEILMKG